MPADPPDTPRSPSLDRRRLRYEPLADRPSKVRLEMLGRPVPPGATLDQWLDGLPAILAGNTLRELRDAIVAARRADRPVLAAIGGHVVKTGCAPYLVDWMARGVLRGLAMNGSAAIHDSELALAGHTSEDVGARLMDGEFGFARETSELFVAATRRASETRSGLGAALGDLLVERGGPGLDSSLLVAARRHRVPLTVHVAVGTDIVHMTPELDGAALGRAALDDFHAFCELVADLRDGVYINIGSAVVMPEIFLKAVSIARNLGKPLDGLTTVNLDFNQQYRGLLNVLQRPGARGRGLPLTGHHEILIPLLHALVVSALPAGDER